MKLIQILLISILLGGCGTFGVKEPQPNRNYPVFVTEGEASAAFKAQTTIKGQDITGVLLINKKDQKYKIKILGDFASLILDADFDGQTVTYNYVFNGMLNKKGKEAFSDIIKIMLQKPANFISTRNDGEEQYINFKDGRYLNRYYFKKGLSYPYKMEQIKTTVRKKIMFDDYQIFNNRPLPSKITLQDGFKFFSLELTLLSVK